MPIQHFINSQENGSTLNEALLPTSTCRKLSTTAVHTTPVSAEWDAVSQPVMCHPPSWAVEPILLASCGGLLQMLPHAVLCSSSSTNAVWGTSHFKEQQHNPKETTSLAASFLWVPPQFLVISLKSIIKYLPSLCLHSNSIYFPRTWPSKPLLYLSLLKWLRALDTSLE